MDFNLLAKNYINDAILDLKELVKIPSVLDEFKPETNEPFGHYNRLALEKFLEIGNKLGFKTYNDNNYAGSLTYGECKESLGILGHLDVVPAVGTWTFGPFNPVIADGKMFGRGTLDDKGGVIASIYALKLLKDQGFVPNKKVEIIAGCDEETGSRCLAHYLANNPSPTIAFSPDASFPVIYGEKGIMTFDILGRVDNDEIISFAGGLRYNIVIDYATLEVKNPKNEYIEKFNQENNLNCKLKDGIYHFYGKASHAMIPHEGINAAYIMFRFMDQYYKSNVSSLACRYFDDFGDKMGIRLHDDEMGDLTINLGIANYQNGSLKLGFNLRVPRDNHKDVIEKGFKDAIRKYQGLEMGEIHYANSHFVAKDSFLVSSLVKSYQEITNDYENQPFTIGGGTYAKAIKEAVAFGPCFPWRKDICHEPDEHIYIEDLEKWIAIYANAIYLLTK